MTEMSPRQVVMIAFSYLVVLLAAALLLDSPLIATGPTSNLRRVLADLGPVEWGQWAMYGLSAIMAASLYGRLAGKQRAPRAQRFWLLMSLFFIWCLIEDAGNQRWVLGGYVRVLLGGRSHDWTSVVYMTALGAFGALTLWRYREVAWEVKESRAYLLTGLGLFALAAGLGEVMLRFITLVFNPPYSLIHTPLILGLDLDYLEEIMEFSAAAFMMTAFYAHWLAAFSPSFRRRASAGERGRTPPP